MTMRFTSRGYIELRKNGQLVSRHVKRDEAAESLASQPDGTYVISTPDTEVVVDRRAFIQSAVAAALAGATADSDGGVITQSGPRYFPPGGSPDIFLDDFDYAVGRTDSAASKDAAFAAAGWGECKDEMQSAGANGWIYTTTSIEGQANLPWAGRALAMEAQPVTEGAQTDYYITYGAQSEPVGTVPPEMWIRFGFIFQSDAGSGKESTIYNRIKFLYPSTSTNHTAGAGEYGWLFMIGHRGYEDIRSSGVPGTFPTDEIFLACMTDTGADGTVGGDNTNSADYPTNRFKLYQNLNNSVKILPNVPAVVTIHIDMSGEQGILEAWIDGTKVMEWIGGVTSGFTWTTPTGVRGGWRMLNMPTTEPGANIAVGSAEGDNWKYIQRFQVASSEAFLEAL